MEFFFNIESEVSSIDTSDDLSFHCDRNPVDFNPEILDYHSDKTSVSDAHCMKTKIHLAFICLVRDLATYIPKCCALLILSLMLAKNP